MTTNAPTYIPRTGSLADRVLDYFRQMPDEELSQTDVSAKFEVPRSSVTACLQSAVINGSLAYEHNADFEMVYTLPKASKPARAPKADALASGADLGKASAVKDKSSRGAVKLPPSALNFDDLKAEHGVPLVGKSHGAAGESKWAPLFAKLTEPDTSVEFPADWKSAVAAQATKLNAQHKKAGVPTAYLVRLTAPGKARIWRTA